jgi:hypothetical protein
VRVPTDLEVTEALAGAGFPACGRTSDGFRVQAAGADTVAVAFRRAPGNRSCEDGDPGAGRMLAGYAGVLREAGWAVIGSTMPGVRVLAVTAGTGHPSAAERPPAEPEPAALARQVATAPA